MQIRTKPDEYAKEYKKEKQNGHLSCDAPCEHRVPCSNGYNIDEIIKAYEKGGMEAVNALRQKTSESAEHKDIQKKKKGGKQYHKTRKELVEQYTILNDVFNEKMSEYEKLYGF